VTNAFFIGSSGIHSNELQLAVSTVALYDYRISCGLLCFDDQLRWWVKPRSTTWFSDYLIQVYNDDRWVQIFRMDKSAVADLCYHLRPSIAKQDTKYKLAILVEIRVCATLLCNNLKL
jgi:hypothetical protein